MFFMFRLSLAAIMATQYSSLARLCLSKYPTIASSTSRCRLLCHKERLQQLTSDLKIIFTFQLHLSTDNKSGVLVLKYRHRGHDLNATSCHILTTEVFVTGNLAFQAMALGKESMVGHWCMQCKASHQQFTDSCELWTMDKPVRCSEDGDT